MATETLEKAFALTRRILAGTTPGDFDKPTPCASWNVRAVANHIVEGANWFAMCVEAGAAPDPDPTKGVDYAAGDLLGSYDVGVKSTLAAFQAPGAMEKTISLPFGDIPGAAFLGIATNDIFVHGWDLARGTGQDSNLDPGIASELLAAAPMFFSEDVRGPDGAAPFGPQQEAPASAPPADQLAAFLGRAV